MGLMENSLAYVKKVTYILNIELERVEVCFVEVVYVEVTLTLNPE